MKRFYVVALVLLASCAGFFGGMIRDALTPEPQPVYAQPVRAQGGIRIALLNLEKVARASKLFQMRKIEWDEAQTELKKQNQKAELEYKSKVAEIQRAAVANPEDNLLSLRVEAQAIEQALKVAKEEQQQYLGALLAQYQKEVLVTVMDELRKYLEKVPYDIVLQDYDDADTDADFFSGAAYAQSLMSKPVLEVPGKLTNKNTYVTDITDAIIARLK